MVKARRITARDDALLDPGAPEWRRGEPFQVALDATPIIAQPSKYIQEKWKNAPYGQTRNLTVRSAHNGERLYFHLSWPDESENGAIGDTDQFVDAVAVLFPVNGDAPLQSMGSPQAPVNAWYWRPDIEHPFNVTAQGTGTTRRTTDEELRASSAYNQGAWTVVIRRNMTTPTKEHAHLSTGTTTRVAFAVWQGANEERGGLKAVTLEWQMLEIEA
jgi:DMSO reductase family type II enzyme heme b subunit